MNQLETALKNIDVTGCRTCPFSSWSEMDARCSVAERSLPTDGEEGNGPVMPGSPPSWCPLPVTVTVVAVKPTPKPPRKWMSTWRCPNLFNGRHAMQADGEKCDTCGFKRG